MTPSQLDTFEMDCEIAGLHIDGFVMEVKSTAWAVKPSFARSLCNCILAPWMGHDDVCVYRLDSDDETVDADLAHASFRVGLEKAKITFRSWTTPRIPLTLSLYTEQFRQCCVEVGLNIKTLTCQYFGAHSGRPPLPDDQLPALRKLKLALHKRNLTVRPVRFFRAHPELNPTGQGIIVALRGGDLRSQDKKKNKFPPGVQRIWYTSPVSTKSGYWQHRCQKDRDDNNPMRQCTNFCVIHSNTPSARCRRHKNS